MMTITLLETEEKSSNTAQKSGIEKFVLKRVWVCCTPHAGRTKGYLRPSDWSEVPSQGVTQ